MNPLDDIDLGTNPFVQEFVHKTLARKYGDPNPPPELSPEELKEVDVLSKHIMEVVDKASCHEIIDYIERKITIISGPFAGATTHASDLLTRLGAWCGHELLMREGGLFIQSIVAGAKIKAECSGDSARWVNVLAKAPLIHLIRDPLKQCNSFFRLRQGKINITDCVGYTLNFHKCIEARKPDLVWRIERHEDLLPVLKHFGIDPPVGRLDAIRKEAKKNSHTKRNDQDVIKWEYFPPSLQDFCLKHGYGPEGKEIFKNDKSSW